MNAGASTYTVPSPIEGSGTAWVLLGSWALSPARPTPIHPRHECRGFSAFFGDEVHPDRPVIFSERGGPLTASSVTKWFFHLYQDLGMTGCSSHSGRRTFITRAARKVSEVGGSVRDVQQLAGHASLQTTQRYIDGDTEAKRKLVQLI